MKNEKKKISGRKKSPADAPINAASGGGEESELRRRIWSVVSFEQCAAKSLTYDEAAAKVAELEKQGVPGLCLVTDAVAEKIAAS
jgi:hypothetical protein